MRESNQTLEKLAFRFVLIIGVVNLFADMTYEGARGITGPFLGSLGASAAAVGLIAGSGELLGYGLRAASGYFADTTHKYWLFAFVGYFVNMLAVPALALAGNWPAAALLIVAERTGRAIRRPSVEAMISHAGKSIGHGWVFGLNEALDQAGATVGPLITAYILYRRGTYHHAFAALFRLQERFFHVPTNWKSGRRRVFIRRDFRRRIGPISQPVRLSPRDLRISH
jgi:hypothetical protein